MNGTDPTNPPSPPRVSPAPSPASSVPQKNATSDPLSTPQKTERNEIEMLQDKLRDADMPPDLKEKTTMLLKRAETNMKQGGTFWGYEQTANYIDWITNLPWKKQSIDTIDTTKAKETLDKYHHGVDAIKNRVLEYLSVMKLNMRNEKHENGDIQDNPMRAPVLFFVGLAGTGKTTMAIAIAEAMGRKFARIPFGGMGSALDLRGESRAHPDAEVGYIMKAVRKCQTRNPVILLDELDRVAEHARSDIMGVLIELLDPEQNAGFIDHYIDYPFNLSQVLFVATANNTGNISTAVMDRLEPIQMPSYTDEEKTVIGRSYVFPKIRKSAGLSDQQLIIDETVWPEIVRPLGFDSGIRTLERTINGMCRKVARQIVEGKTTAVHITSANCKQFLPTW